MRLLIAFVCLIVLASANRLLPAQEQSTSSTPASVSASEPIAKPDFKISTSVYIPESTKPVSENLTLFQDQLVFDIRFDGQNPIEFSIYDAHEQKFILLDVPRQQRLELDKIQIFTILDGMKKELLANERTASLAQMDFQEQYSIENQSLKIESEVVSYSAQGTRPEFDTVLPRYHEFLECFTMLSATSPQAFPPFARIALNRSIKKYGFVPATVSRTLKPSEFARVARTVTSSHRLELALSQSDLNWIHQGKKYWTQFPKVDLAQYRSIEIPRTANRPLSDKR